MDHLLQRSNIPALQRRAKKVDGLRGKIRLDTFCIPQNIAHVSGNDVIQIFLGELSETHRHTG